jgi:hypothetical protein
MLEAQDMSYTATKVRAIHPVSHDPLNQFHICRGNDGPVISTSTVSSSYDPLSPSNMAEQLQPFVEQGWAVPDYAFTRKNGSVEVVALKLDEAGFDSDLEDKTGDSFKWWLVAQNHHSNGAAFASVYGERLICKNGMVSIANQTKFSIHHRGNAQARLEQGFRQWEGLKAVIRKMAIRMGMYIDYPMDVVAAKALTNIILDIESGIPEEEISARTRKVRDRILDAFYMPSFGTNGSTAYDYFNAITYVNSHLPEGSKVTEETLSNGLLMGNRGLTEKKAIEMLDELVGA